MTRAEALVELERPTYDPAQQLEDKVFVAKKLGVTPAELDAIFAQPNRSYSDFASSDRLLSVALKVKRAVFGV